MDRALEIELWRESTTVFMTSGIGGCTPFGLALAALKRGFAAELYTSTGQSFFADSVRDPIKKEVIRLVQEGFIRELKRRKTPIHGGLPALGKLMRHVDDGEIPVVLISSYRIYGKKAPHWVVVTGYDERFVYVHDPYVDSDEGETLIDSLNMPILHREFTRMARYGRAGLQAALFVSAAQTWLNRSSSWPIPTVPAATGRRAAHAGTRGIPRATQPDNGTSVARRQSRAYLSLSLHRLLLFAPRRGARRARHPQRTHH